MTQVARPAEDTFYPVPPPNGSDFQAWRNELEETDQNLFESINTFLPNDLTFAEAGALLGLVGTEPIPLPQEIVPYVTKLTEVDSPETADQGLTVRVRLAKDIGAGHAVTCLVGFREEYNNELTDLGILIASETFVDITEVFQDFSFPVTPAQAAGITDFTNLYLRFVFTYA